MVPEKTGNVHVAAQQIPCRVTIDILPEDVLLEIFDFYVDPTRKHDGPVEAWCTLVHVCRRWRNIVLESPLRLNLRICCRPATPVWEKLDTWPTLPIVVEQCEEKWQPKWGMANVAAALEQNNRICQIGLWGVPTLQMREILAAMHKSFPVLTDLNLESEDETLPTVVDPDFFLGGSAPSLRSLQLAYIPFPGLPKLLSSATHLTSLGLFNVSHSGYISPEAMVSCFSALTRLETVVLEFESFPFREHRPPPPPTCALLPALTWFQFIGVGEYLEDFVVRIDTPLLDTLIISLFHEFIPDTSQLAQFINRTPTLKAHNEVHVVFDDSRVRLTCGREFEKMLEISFEVEEDRQVSCMAEACTSSLSQAFSATVECLYISDDCAYQQGDIRVESNHWLELLRPFISVKSLYLSRVIVPRIAPALKELVGETVAGGLPALQTLFLEDLNLSGPVQEAIGSFVSGQSQFSSHPVTISHWRRERQWGD